MSLNKRVIAEKLKVMFLSTGTGVGGAETQIIAVGSRLQELGHQVMIVSMSEVGRLGLMARGAGLTVESLGMKRGSPVPAIPVAVIRLHALLYKFKPDVLVSFMFYANLLGRLTGSLARVPVNISSIRSERFGGSLSGALLRMTDCFGDGVLTNSRLVGHNLVSRKVVPAARIHVVPNGIRLQQFMSNEVSRRTIRDEFQVPDDNFLWLAVGRLHAAKGYPVLLKAFSRLVAEYPTARLIIVGDGPAAGALDELSRNLGISDRVCFAGERTDIADLLSAADSLVLSSEWEGLPNIIIEAQAAGLPVVATEVGGVGELVFEGENGYLASPGDPAGLSTKMLRMMMLSAQQREQMGGAGKRQVEETFELGRVSNLWEKLFLDLLGSKGFLAKQR